jgi:sugar phosphate isomerase/epimerase
LGPGSKFIEKEQTMQSYAAFHYCLNTSTIQACGLDISGKIRVIDQAGYQGIELWLSEIDGYVEQGGQLSRLKQMLDHHGLQVPNIIAFFQWSNPDSGIRKKELEEARRVLAIARELDCMYVAAPPAGIVDMPEIPLADIAGYYSDLLEIGRDIGVKPILEFWGHSKILCSLEQAIEVLEMVDQPDAMLLADVFHMAKAGDSFDLLGKLKGSQLGLFHVNDYPGAPDVSKLSDAQRVYPGDGAAPLGKIVGILREIGYSGVLSLELFNKEYQENGAESVAKTGIDKMRKMFGN